MHSAANYENLIPNDDATECCACDEAKYEMVFDGIWSPRTHPKDFPTRMLNFCTYFANP